MKYFWALLLLSAFIVGPMSCNNSPSSPTSSSATPTPTYQSPGCSYGGC